MRGGTSLRGQGCVGLIAGVMGKHSAAGILHSEAHCSCLKSSASSLSDFSWSLSHSMF